MGSKPLVGLGLGLALSDVGILLATVRLLSGPVPGPGRRPGAADLRPDCPGAGTCRPATAQGLLVLLRQRRRLLPDRPDLSGSLDQSPAAQRVASYPRV